MLSYDASILKILDEENPLSVEELTELDCIVDKANARALATISEGNPTLTQMIVQVDPASSTFWDNLDLSSVGVSRTIEPAGGSLSGS